MSRLIDLTGKKYGLLTVLENTGEKDSTGRKYLQKCQCECGNICFRTKDSLEHPSKKPKACSTQCQNGIKVGDKFNRLTVIKIIPKTGSETQYLCKCDCGNEISTLAAKLKNNRIKSCGCYRQERMQEIGKNNSFPIDITGQKFGNLTAIEPTEQRQNRSIIQKCKCDCGNVYYASVKNLKDGNVIHCDNCQIISKGEEKIAFLLKEANIPYERQKTFNDCTFEDTGYPAKFDFYVNNEYIIEFDGMQHFKQKKSIQQPTEEDFKKLQRKDQFKNEYCKKNNIPIIRIPYIYLNQIQLKDLLLDTTKYLLL